MSKLTLKQKKGGAVNVYKVEMTVYIHHQSEKEARSYLYTAMEDWGCDGKIIACVDTHNIEESNKRFFASGVVYPEDYDSLQETKE